MFSLNMKATIIIYLPLMSCKLFNLCSFGHMKRYTDAILKEKTLCKQSYQNFAKQEKN